MSKYILTKEIEATESGVTLYRIQAIKDIDMYGIKAGDLGGFIQSEANLAQTGSCWVYPQASVIHGVVKDDARVSDFALILSGTVSDRAIISGNAKVGGDALIAGDAIVSGSAQVMDYAKVFDFALVYGDALVFGNAKVFGQGGVCENAWVSEHGWVFGDGVVAGNTRIAGQVRFSANAVLDGAGRHRGSQVMDDNYMDRYHRRLSHLIGLKASGRTRLFC